MTEKPVSGVLLDETIRLSLAEVCHACSCQSEWIVELVSEGILEPVGGNHVQWTFQGDHLRKVFAARRLQQDLGINLEGVALVLDLLDEVETLRLELRSQSSTHE